MTGDEVMGPIDLESQMESLIFLTHDGSMVFTYIYLHGWLIFMVNVGKYTSPMDPMGYKCP